MVLAIGRGLFLESAFLALIAFSYGWVGIGSLDVGGSSAANTYGAELPVERLPPA
jgi:hypothetical protein